MRYCETCKIKYGLNDRAFKLFSDVCGICNYKTTMVNFDTTTIMDRDINVVIWEKPIKIQSGKRLIDILITKRTNL